MTEQSNTQMSLELDAPVWTVTTLTAGIQRALSHEFSDIRVAGEISGYKVWQSGHAYFTLKDASAQIRCVLFRNALRYMRFRPQDGIAVVARGSVEVRQERGEYQLVVSGLEPQGFGELQLAFEQLKQRLAAEGLFDQDRKRPLPRFPERIGIVTSPKGAVIRDMLTVLRRRWRGLHIRLYPTLVQGEGAIEGICDGLRHFSGGGWAQVVIVGRGGGSLEDRWAFNDEAVARAIAASQIPVVSAVGHETDFTIADFVADLRAPTPSAAAELVAPSRDEYLQRVDALRTHAARSMRYSLSDLRRRLGERGLERAQLLVSRRVDRGLQRVDELEYTARVVIASELAACAERWRAMDARLRHLDLRLRLGRSREHLGSLERRLAERMRSALANAHRRLDPPASKLKSLSPLSVLERGYAIVQDRQGRALRRASDTKPGEMLAIRLHEGRVSAEVRETEST